MKKKIFSLVTIMMMALTLPLFTSCGNDNGDKDDVDPIVKEVTLYINVTPSADMLKYADLQITYTDDQGVDKYADVNSEDYKVSLSLTKFPVNGTLKYTCTPKSGVSPADTDKITVCTGIYVTKVTTYSDGTSETGSISSVSGTMSFYGSKLSAWFENYATIGSYDIAIDKEGKLVK